MVKKLLKANLRFAITVCYMQQTLWNAETEPRLVYFSLH